MYRCCAVALVAAVGLFSAGCVSDDPNPIGDAMAAVEEQAAGASELQPGATINFIGDEFSFTPMQVNAAPGVYNATFTNVGSVRHDISFEDGTTVVADPGEAVDFEITVPEEGLPFVCTIPGHADSGMVGAIVTAGTPVELVSTAGGGGSRIECRRTRSIGSGLRPP